MRQNKAIWVIGAVAVLVLMFSTFFVVPQTGQAVVLQFGAYKWETKEPGLHAKLPFVQDVMMFDKRILDLDPPVTSVLMNDQLRVDVDAYARYRIVQPIEFFKSVRTEDGLNNRLGATINNKMRSEMAKVTLTDVLSDKREQIMKSILDAVRLEASRFGVEVIDIRIGRAELPDEISSSTFARMRADREQRAKEARAEGAEKATQIRATADKERVLVLADATKQAEIVRGEGDAVRARILGDAYGRDPRFADFTRAMTAYRESFAKGDTTVVLSPTSEFFKYFQNGVRK